MIKHTYFIVKHSFTNSHGINQTDLALHPSVRKWLRHKQIKRTFSVHKV